MTPAAAAGILVRAEKYASQAASYAMAVANDDSADTLRHMAAARAAARAALIMALNDQTEKAK